MQIMQMFLVFFLFLIIDCAHKIAVAWNHENYTGSEEVHYQKLVMSMVRLSL